MRLEMLMISLHHEDIHKKIHTAVTLLSVTININLKKQTSGLCSLD